MQLVARKRFKYGGKWLDSGEPFEAKSKRDFQFLVAIKRARKAEDGADAVQSRPAAVPFSPRAEIAKLHGIESEGAHLVDATLDQCADAEAEPASDPIEEAIHAEQLDEGQDDGEADDPEDQDVSQDAADSEGGDISPRTGKPKRKYRRRDLQAED